MLFHVREKEWLGIKHRMTGFAYSDPQITKQSFSKTSYGPKNINEMTRLLMHISVPNYRRTR
jgi:hypothetical protein